MFLCPHLSQPVTLPSSFLKGRGNVYNESDKSQSCVFSGATILQYLNRNEIRIGEVVHNLGMVFGTEFVIPNMPLWHEDYIEL